MEMIEGVAGKAVQLTVGQEWEQGQGQGQEHERGREQGQRQLEDGSCWTLPIQLQLVSGFCEAKTDTGGQDRLRSRSEGELFGLYGAAEYMQLYASICNHNVSD
jgi:hypothetical protein